MVKEELKTEETDDTGVLLEKENVKKKKIKKEEQKMEGFIQNISEEYQIALKQHIKPGGLVSFEDAYKLIGEPKGMPRGNSFVEEVKSRFFNKNKWRVITGKKELSKITLDGQILEVSSNKIDIRSKKVSARDMSAKDITAKHIIDSDIEAALELVDKCNNYQVVAEAAHVLSHSGTGKGKVRIKLENRKMQLVATKGRIE